MKFRPRRKEDRRALGFVVLCLAGFLALLALPFSSLGDLEILGIDSLMILSVFVVSVINHNHRHCLVLSSENENQILNLMISCCIGAPSSRLHQVHLFNHHRHYRSEKDWTCYKSTGSGRGFFRLGSYAVVGSWRIARRRHELLGEDPEMDRGLKREKRALAIWFLVGLVMNPRIVLFCWVPAWIFGLLVLFISNLLNHVDCDLDSKLNHSRDFLNPFENWLLFNNGYHTAHHLRPAQHWSELPSHHLQLVGPQKSPELVMGSFFLYLFRSFWPAKRSNR